MLTGSFCASRREFLKALAVLPFALPTRRNALELKIAIVHDAALPDVLRGARMSITEIQRAAALLGFRASAAEHTEATGITAAGVVSSVASDVLNRLAVPVISTVPAAPGTHIWHIDNVDWDPEGEKFGAGQLNARFRAAYGAPMSTHAWHGWFGVKVLWESALRARSAAPEAIQAYLSSPRAGFDGHLGRPLRFDPITHRIQ